MSEAQFCPPIIRYCKHGHLRTRETLFQRKARVNGKEYIVHECRICHSMRSSKIAPFGKRSSTSKWKRFLARSEA
jgi:hypothetical protein